MYINWSNFNLLKFFATFFFQQTQFQDQYISRFLQIYSIFIALTKVESSQSYLQSQSGEFVIPSPKNCTQIYIGRFIFEELFRSLYEMQVGQQHASQIYVHNFLYVENRTLEKLVEANLFIKWFLHIYCFRYIQEIYFYVVRRVCSMQNHRKNFLQTSVGCKQVRGASSILLKLFVQQINSSFLQNKFVVFG
eukprot:TRINITY_DN1805_c0_g1_i6.p3 TRINITY_DN1805_c0_g1~~TRINITY_DN1805_c0_g1_i6.p3  ORF type:complete len:192 (+),score=-8.89 TRINITY_DN1805_c0_g1_i6:914-1489(+)